MTRHRMWGILGVISVWGCAGTLFAVQPQTIGDPPGRIAARAGLVGVVTFGDSNGIAVIKDTQLGRSAALSIGDRLPFASTYRVKSIARGRVEVTNGTATVTIRPMDDESPAPAIITDDDDFATNRPATPVVADDRVAELHPALIDSRSVIQDAGTVMEELVIDDKSDEVAMGHRIYRLSSAEPQKVASTRYWAPPSQPGPEGIPLSPDMLDRVDKLISGSDAFDASGDEE